MINNRKHDQNDIKQSTIYTPPPMAEYIFKTISPFFNSSYTIIDAGCGDGNLGAPFGKKDYWVYGLDIRLNAKRLVFDKCYYDTWEMNFLKNTFPFSINKSLILCNPPFNRDGNNPDFPRSELIPFAFLEKIFQTWGHSVPVVIFTPEGFTYNQRLFSTRYELIAEWEAKGLCQKSAVVPLPLDTFPGRLVQCDIQFWNMPHIKNHNLPRYVREEIKKYHDSLK